MEAAIFTSMAFPACILALYLYLPFLALYHSIYLFFPDKLPEVNNKFPMLDDAKDIPFLKFFELCGEALPQFILGLVFYVNHTYFINKNDTLFGNYLPIPLVSIIFSGLIVSLGLMEGISTVKFLYNEGRLTYKHERGVQDVDKIIMEIEEVESEP